MLLRGSVLEQFRAGMAFSYLRESLMRHVVSRPRCPKVSFEDKLLLLRRLRDCPFSESETLEDFHSGAALFLQVSRLSTRNFLSDSSEYWRSTVILSAAFPFVATVEHASFSDRSLVGPVGSGSILFMFPLAMRADQSLMVPENEITPAQFSRGPSSVRLSAPNSGPLFRLGGGGARWYSSPGTVWGRGGESSSLWGPSIVVIVAVVRVVPGGGSVAVKTRSYGALVLPEACLGICLEAWSLCFFACEVAW
ncbi:hypothetical protein Tco_1554581 [Tanacetum coccineum]